ncbi:unknown [Crocosphaera subtropica ATCC 51142]|uniref:Universal stress protein n=1 Tax=Crocosphaera subtropica (strain ATCC 51142 / BH68) TaxID=43989 RepID=B1WUV3_CROS5|nr:universal stress protein [Crocosphaera subtropica]ACB50554.1 unknown [Crocosphaera subtropica ATCC 51142]
MNLLVAVDCSDSTQKVVKKAQEMAKTLSAKLWLIHVAQPEPDFVGYETGPQTVRNYVAETFHAEHSQIQEIAETLRKEGIEATALLIQGSTVETIIKEAEKLAVDMIIMGSHERNPISELFLGSVSKGVISQSQCPILIVPTRS